MSVEITWVGMNITAHVVRNASDGSLALHLMGPEGIEIAAAFADLGDFGLMVMDDGIPALRVGNCFMPVNADVHAMLTHELAPERLQ